MGSSEVPGLSTRQMAYLLEMDSDSFREFAAGCDPVQKVKHAHVEYYPRDLLAFMTIKTLVRQGVGTGELRESGACEQIFSVCWEADDEYLDLYPMVIGFEPISARITVFNEHKRPRGQVQTFAFAATIDEMKRKICGFGRNARRGITSENPRSSETTPT